MTSYHHWFMLQLDEAKSMQDLVNFVVNYLSIYSNSTVVEKKLHLVIRVICCSRRWWVEKQRIAKIDDGLKCTPVFSTYCRLPFLPILPVQGFVSFRRVWIESVVQMCKKTTFLCFLIFKVAMLKHTCSLSLSLSRQTCMRNTCTRENSQEDTFSLFLSPKVRHVVLNPKATCYFIRSNYIYNILHVTDPVYICTN